MNFFYVDQLSRLNQELVENKNKIDVSFEFFPPRTRQKEKLLLKTVEKFEQFKPKFISITERAGSQNKIHTYNLFKKITQHVQCTVVPHLTCLGSKPTQLERMAKKYWDRGVRSIVALRGDPSSLHHDLSMHGCDFVRILKKTRNFDISVAAYPEVHPEATNAQSDLFYLKKKIDAGANRAITQFFFDVAQYLRFRDRCVSVGIQAEIVPGILPIYDFVQLKKFSRSTNVRIPHWIRILFENSKDDYRTQRIIGSSVLIDMVKILRREGVEHFHFYTLNRFRSICAACRILRVNA